MQHASTEVLPAFYTLGAVKYVWVKLQQWSFAKDRGHGQ